MQPIERYGVIALIFLVITVVAVVFWDQRPANAQEPGGAVARKDGFVEKAGRLKDGAADLISLRSQTKKRSPNGRALGKQAPGAEANGGQAAPANERARAAALQARGGQAPGGDEIPPGLLAVAKREAQERARAQDTTQPPAAKQPVRTQPEPRRTEPAPVAAAQKSAPRRGGELPLYTVQSGDTLSEIAMAQLGTMKRWKEIVDLNPGLDASRLRVGARLVMPADAGSGRPAASTDVANEAQGGASGQQPAKAGSTYTVREADSLWKIAARTLGDGERWREIAKLNPKMDPDRLSVGQKLVLPAGARAGAPAAAPRNRDGERLVAAAPKNPKNPKNMGASRKGRVQ